MPLPPRCNQGGLADAPAYARADLHAARRSDFVRPARACARADTLAEIHQRGTLRWGGDASGGGPYIYQGPDNQLTGFELEFAEYLAAKLGVKSEFVPWEWEMLPQILDRGTIDVVLNGYEWSAERERLWSSTVPYYIYTLELMTRSNDDSIGSWDDLVASPGRPRKSVGVLQGSAAERYVEAEYGASVVLKKYPEVTSVMGLVEKGQLDAVVQDVPIGVYYGRDFPGLHTVGEPRAPGYYVAYVRKGDEQLRLALNAAIAAAIADGTLERIYKKYGIWNDAQTRLAEVAHEWPPTAAADESRWTNFGHYTLMLLARPGSRSSSRSFRCRWRSRSGCSSRSAGSTAPAGSACRSKATSS